MITIKKNTLVINPWGGLCNRMQAMDSAIALSLSIGKQLHVLWYKDRTFNCDFSQLFVVPPQIAHLEQISLQTLRGRIRHRLLKAFGPMMYDTFYDNRKIATLNKAHYDYKRLAGQNSIYISTYLNFYPSLQPFRFFKPVAGIRTAVRELTGAFTDNTVGVHIRRSDNRMATQHSPISGFIELMRLELANDPATRFFLATDSPDVEEHLEAIFPDRITIHPKKSLDRNVPEAIQDALVDLLCLAATRKLIGSYWSTFTNAAAAIGGIESVIVHEV